MAFSYKALVSMDTIDASASAKFTNPTGKTSYIRSIILHNADSGSQQVKLYRVASGGSAQEYTNKFYDVDMPSRSTYIIELRAPGMVLDSDGDMIQGVADTAGRVTIQIYGGQE